MDLICRFQWEEQETGARNKMQENGQEQAARRIRAVLHLVNAGNEELSGTYCLQTPLEAQPFGKREICFGTLSAGETLELPMEFQFSSGGCHLFLGWLKGRETEYLWKWPVRLGGSGFYSGDTHTHSLYSDGKGTLSENRDAMFEKGHSFLYSTDHNTIKQAEEIKTFEEEDRKRGFLHLTGWEFTTKFGHSIAYGTKIPQDPLQITERGDAGAWQEYIDGRNREKGIVYLCHPYEAPIYEFGEAVLDSVRDIAGIEVWNGYNHHALAYQNRKAFAKWDELNVSRGLKLSGNAVSDAHTSKKQGDPYIKGILSELAEAEIHRMLKSGAFFGSNGPEIRFTINDAGIGEDCRISGKTLVHGRLTVFDPLGQLEEIILYRGMRQDRTETLARKKIRKILDVFPVGEERTVWIKDWYFYAEPGDFYRAEVISGQNLAGFNGSERTEEKGFAYTNPIWMEER